MGIPFDRLRKLSLILGPRVVFTMGSHERTALLAGFRAGLRLRTPGEFGFYGTGFAEGGGAGFTDLGAGRLGTAPYVEGGASLGLGWGRLNINVEGATGGRTSLVEATPGGEASPQWQRYYRIGIGIGGTF